MFTIRSKWMPSCNATSYKTKENATVVRKYLGFTERQYRKILSELRERKMIGTVIRRNCFVDENVRELNIMGMSGCVITVTFLIKEILAWTAAGIVIVIVFFIAALFSFVLAGVFAEAVRYKKENDLTI